MTNKELQEIRERWEAVKLYIVTGDVFIDSMIREDIPALLDEIEGLQTEVKRLQAIIDEFPDTISLETIGG